MNQTIDEINKGYLKELDYNAIQVLENISDSSSEVKHALIKTNNHVVLKFLKKYQNEHEYYNKFDRERANLRKIFQNDNVISFYGVTKEPSKKFHSMVLQYCGNKNLREHLREEYVAKSNWSYKKRIAIEIATGLEYIHQANIVHCDLVNIKKLKTFLALENREEPINLTPVDYKELYCDSWNSNPEKRPLINEVIDRLNDIELDCVYQDFNYIPEISSGSSFRDRIRFTSNNAACLEVTKGSVLNLYIFLPPGEISIGRSNSNDVIIKDQEIAKKHARIIVNYQGQVEINELGSDYGIFVNDKKLEFRASRLLIKDDVISMGRSKFQYLPIGEYKSRIDEPLSIYNKAYFLKKLENEFKNAKENKCDLSLLFLDLDNFKSINDQNDHIVGDYVLKELANLIRNNHVRSEDIFARYGGDEFTILLKGTNINSAFKIAENIRGSVEAHSFTYNKIKLSITLSIGVSEMNSSTESCDDLLLHADNASKKAKEYGRNRIEVWNNESNSISRSETHLIDSPNKSVEGESYYIESHSSLSSTIDTSFFSTMNSSSQIMDDEIGITIIKSNSENKRTECYMFLPRKETLNFIRTKLEEYDEFYMGTNCRFIINNENGVPVLRKDESKFKVLQIIGTHDNGANFLYIKEKAEFDRLLLKNEKGFKFCKEGSIEKARDNAFKIDINKIEFSDPRYDDCENQSYMCNHAPDANCKRSLIIDGKFSDALEWFYNSLKLPRANTKPPTIHLHEWRPKKEITILGISATDEFIKDVEAALKNNEKNSEEGIIKQLRNVSEKYGHFYAHRLVLGGAIVKNKSVSDDVVISTSVISGNKDKYFKENIKSWDESLGNASTWKIIGYDKIYSLFELLNGDLQKEVLNALGHRILKAGTKDINFELRNYTNSISPYIYNLSSHIKEIGNIHNYQIFASIMSKSNKNLFSAHVDYLNKDRNTPVIIVHNIKWENSGSATCLIKLGWIIVGPLTNFDFNIQFPLAFRCMKQMASMKKDLCTIKINNYKPCIFGICALEADSQSSSRSDNDSTRNENPQLSSTSIVDSTEYIPYDLNYDPKTVEIVAGTHFSTYKESACLFVYNLKDINKPVDQTVLQNLALYTCVIDVDDYEDFDFGQENVKWQSSKREKISYANIGTKKLSDNDLLLVSQLFNNCPACKHYGFVNVNHNTSQVIYKSLSSELLDSVEDIAYLLISPVNKPKN
ncbi:28435_t:CDS:2 [Dentiscutata erythropus]|uniref:28435_t:CDS:1 n=1 Tax=Dentiscutata erythropus TaxID=1348616 RepID=A0A9N9G4V5_9GLOM|nr:28435_t:CDS:2 [Dentiscutata erythropus]